MRVVIAYESRVEFVRSNPKTASLRRFSYRQRAESLRRHAFTRTKFAGGTLRLRPLGRYHGMEQVCPPPLQPETLARDLSTMKILRMPPSFVLLALSGCGTEARVNSRNFQVDLLREPAHSKAAMAPAADASRPARVEMAGEKSKATNAALVAIQTGLNLPPGGSAPIARKIIYDAQVDLIVEASTRSPRKWARWFRMPAATSPSKPSPDRPDPGARCAGDSAFRWNSSIPSSKRSSRSASSSETTARRRTSPSSTTTSRPGSRTRRVEEQTLNKILQERSGKLEDVLKIEIELSRVRGEIEQLEGKIRVLENLSSLATLTLNVRERDKYAPPPPVVADFRTQIARTWEGSLLDLVNMGKAGRALGRELGDLDTVLARVGPDRLGSRRWLIRGLHTKPAQTRRPWLARRSPFPAHRQQVVSLVMNAA